MPPTVFKFHEYPQYFSNYGGRGNRIVLFGNDGKEMNNL